MIQIGFLKEPNDQNLLQVCIANKRTSIKSYQLDISQGQFEFEQKSDAHKLTVTTAL